jgi:hypothetical protein
VLESSWFYSQHCKEKKSNVQTITAKRRRKGKEKEKGKNGLGKEKGWDGNSGENINKGKKKMFHDFVLLYHYLIKTQMRLF